MTDFAEAVDPLALGWEWSAEEIKRFGYQVVYLIAEHLWDTHWVQNLVADPRVAVRVGGERFSARARVVDAAAELDLHERIRRLDRFAVDLQDAIVDLETGLLRAGVLDLHGLHGIELGVFGIFRRNVCVRVDGMHGTDLHACHAIDAVIGMNYHLIFHFVEARDGADFYAVGGLASVTFLGHDVGHGISVIQGCVKKLCYEY